MHFSLDPLILEHCFGVEGLVNGILCIGEFDLFSFGYLYLFIFFPDSRKLVGISSGTLLLFPFLKFTKLRLLLIDIVLFEDNSVVVSTIIVIIDLVEVFKLALIVRIHKLTQVLLGSVSPSYVPPDPFLSLPLGLILSLFVLSFKFPLQYELSDCFVVSEF